MKTLATYKREYKRAKTPDGKQSAMNRAMLNLSTEDSHKFLAWQIAEMHKSQNILELLG